MILADAGRDEFKATGTVVDPLDYLLGLAGFQGRDRSGDLPDGRIVGDCLDKRGSFGLAPVGGRDVSASQAAQVDLVVRAWIERGGLMG
jgi:hypothetical protein